jgi:LysM repeat protein
MWKLGLQYGIPIHEIMEANGIAQDTVLYPGQKLRIPVHHVPVRPTPGPQYGEYLDWWAEAQYLWPIGKTAVIQDFETGVVWNVRRTIGANHADVEPLTWEDTEIMKELWGGWNWEVRPVLVIVDGRKIAASASAMPHGVQYIKNNGFDGHFDVHFKNSTRHRDGKIDIEHQERVKKAAGY